MKRFFSDLSFFLFLIGVLIHQLAVSKYGLAIFPDSVNYIHAGKSFLNSFEFHQFTGEYFVSWPPFYPLQLSLISLFGENFYIISSIYHAVIYGLTLVILQKIIVFEIPKSHLTRQYLSLLFLLLIGAIPIMQLSLEFVSETGFIFLALLGFYVGIQKKRIYLGLIVFSLLMLQRYIGIIWWASFSIIIFLSISNKKKWSLFVVLSSTPFLLWIFRNYHLTQTFSGQRGDSFISLTDNLLLGLDVISKWIMPHFFPFGIRFFVLILLFTFSILLLLKATKVNLSKPFLFLNHFKTIDSTTIISILLIWIYFLSLWLISTSGKSEALSFRMLAPMYPFFLIAIFRYFLINIETQKPFIRLILFSGLLLICLLQITFSFRYISSKMEFGAGGFNTTEWRDSDFYSWYKETGFQLPIKASNTPDAFYALFSKQIMFTPFQFEDVKLNELKTNSGDSVIVWINLMKRKTLIQEDSLVNYLNLKIDFKSPSFTVYHIPNINF